MESQNSVPNWQDCLENKAKQNLESSIESVRRGNREDYRIVVDFCLPSVRAFVASRSLPGIDVDDVVQRVFVEAFQAIGEYRRGTEFLPWLLTIARYQLMMDATRLKRLADYHSRYVPVEIARVSEDRLAMTADEDTRLAYLRDCLAGISRKGRDVLRRRYEEGQSTQQIATSLDRSDGAIRKQLSLLRKQLHDCIAGKMIAGDGHGA